MTTSFCAILILFRTKNRKKSCYPVLDIRVGFIWCFPASSSVSDKLLFIRNSIFYQNSEWLSLSIRYQDTSKFFIKDVMKWFWCILFNGPSQKRTPLLHWRIRREEVSIDGYFSGILAQQLILQLVFIEDWSVRKDRITVTILSIVSCRLWCQDYTLLTCRILMRLGLFDLIKAAVGVLPWSACRWQFICCWGELHANWL